MSEALVDPHIHPELPGLSPDSSKGEDGVNYLRRLRGAAAEGAPANATAKVGDKAPAATATPGVVERRKSLRLRCSGSVEFRTAGSDARMWGTLTDVSLHGCYVEMSNTFPVDTKVYLVLRSCGIRIQAPGTVRASYPALGMGICFAEIEPEQELQLKQLLATLAGRSAVSNVGSAPEDGMKDMLATADPNAFLDQIREFFQKNQLLSREEFYSIAKRVRRS